MAEWLRCLTVDVVHFFNRWFETHLFLFLFYFYLLVKQIIFASSTLPRGLELVWAQVKGHVARNKLTFNMGNVTALVNDAFDNVTSSSEIDI